VEECDVILAIRSDFYETHPVFGMVVNQAVKRHGAKLLVVSDKKGKFTKLPNAQTLLNAPGLEVNVLNAMAQTLLEENLAVTDGVEGIAEFKAALADYTPEKVAGQTGVAADAIREAARKLAAAKKSAILLAYGLPYAGDSRELGIAAANLAILTGSAGREGSGLYLCGEKANSQGAIDMGILPAKGAFGAQRMLEAAAAADLSALYVIGEDPLSSYPDRDKVEAALEKASFVVVQDIFLTPTAEKADVVLPAVSFAEKDGTFTNAERRLQRVRRGVPSPGEAKSDLAIFEMLAARSGSHVSHTGPAAVFTEITASIPEYAGIAFDSIGPKGIVWGGDTLALARKKVLPAAGGKASEGPFTLVTGSALYHSGTVSTRAKGPMAVVSESYIELAREDASALEVNEGDLLTVTGNGVEIKLKAKVGTRLPKGVLFAPYHFGGAGINRLYKGETAVAVQLSK
jgi:predicted molibdopterin-dependent oxidoreductase YjgC